MIAKISKGRAMKSLAGYLLNGSNNEQPNRGKVLATNFAGSDIRSWSREFSAFRKLKPNLSRAVAHISLNLSPEENYVDDAVFVEIAMKFKAGLGYTEDCPFVLVRHSDREHQHVHLMLSRISLKGVVPETNDFRKAEQLAAALRKEFRLKGPADKKKKNEEDDMQNQQSMADKRTAAILDRLEIASQEAEASLASVAEPDAPSIEPFEQLSVKQSRDIRREIQMADYQRAMNELFIEQLRYVRKGTKALTLYFKDGGRLYDAGDRVTAFATPDPAIAAQRLMDVVAMKGWDGGFVVRGSDEMIRQAAIIAVLRNLPMVAIDAHQLAIINAVRQSLVVQPSVSPSNSNSSVPSPQPPNPLRQLTGARNIGERLENRRENADDKKGMGAPASRPFSLGRMRP